MLCNLCWRMLRGQDGRQWRGTYDLHYQHHENAASLQVSAAEFCGICRVLQEDLIESLGSNTAGADAKFALTASLSLLHDTPGLYRLDFNLECDELRRKKTFVLKEIGDESRQFHTPVSDNTSSDEVFTMALKWIAQCSCAKDRPAVYPKRLLDLSDLKAQDFLDIKKLVSIGQEHARKLDTTVVRLVETPAWQHERPPRIAYPHIERTHMWNGLTTLNHMRK